jgi:hypothetical protein
MSDFPEMQRMRLLLLAVPPSLEINELFDMASV